jgi:hypothetical protein
MTLAKGVKMTEIKPIETRYAGCRFRSRLEARYAIWFERLGIDWLYEPEGFEVGPRARRRAYLPDFYLPQLRLWVEVKGHEAAFDRTLLLDAADVTHGLPVALGEADADQGLIKLRVLLLGPVPSLPRLHTSIASFRGVLARQSVTPFCLLPDSGDHPEFESEHRHVFTPVLGPLRVGVECDEHTLFNGALKAKLFGFHCPKIKSAYMAARSARFEHGEQG